MTSDLASNKNITAGNCTCYVDVQRGIMESDGIGEEGFLFMLSEALYASESVVKSASQFSQNTMMVGAWER